jgi:glycosyltransferase involved in cell wall biosynthesis
MIEITIPILNEEKTLYQQVKKVYIYIQNKLGDYENVNIILADNGSTDNTQKIAQKITLEFPCIQYIRLEKKGVGRALKASWSQSKADIIGYMDLDLATDLSYIRPVLDMLMSDKADIVTGSRLAKGSTVIGRSLFRTFISRCFNQILYMTFHTSITDGMCGFKFLKKCYLKNILESGAVSDGWFFATEILIIGKHLGYRVIDIPVKWTDDPDSKVNVRKLAIEYIKAMIALRKRIR